jgi:son of sevenless-like protein
VDLDKIASDYETPKDTQRQPSTVSGSVTVRPSLVTAFSQVSTSTITSASNAQQSGRSSSASFRSTSNADQSGGDDWNHLSQFKVEFPSMASLPKLSQLRIDTDRDVAPMKGQPLSAMQLRPGPNRAMTNPIHTQPDMRFYVVAHDYDPREITFNSEGNMVGASLTVLVEKMTPHDGPVDSMFWASFFYTFRLHTNPLDLTEALIRRYDIMPPSNIAMTEREQEMWVERKVVPVRLRVYNLLKAWLDTYWKPEADDVALETMKEFAIEVVQPTLPAMAPRLLEAIRKRSSGPLSASMDRPGSSASSYNDHSRRSHSRTLSTDKLSLKSPLSLLSPNATTPGPSSAGFSQLSTLPPTPIISKSLNTLLQKPGVELSRIPLTEFDTLELARQLTIMESKMFNQVAPEDLLLTGRRKVAGLKALSETSNQITGWIADTILAELDIKKRTTLLKFYIKLADVSLIAPFWRQS